MKHQNERGQSLIEVIIALGVLMVVVVGFTNLVLTGLQNARHTRNQEEANQFARNAIEIIRAVRDRAIPLNDTPPVNWDTILDADRSYPISATGNCWQISNETFPDYQVSSTSCSSAAPQISGTIFTREIRVFDSTEPDRDFIDVRVVVRWLDAEGARSVELATKIARLY